MKLYDFQVETLKNFVFMTTLALVISIFVSIFNGLDYGVIFFGMSGLIITFQAIADFFDGNSLGNWKPFKEKFGKNYGRKTIISEMIILPIEVIIIFIYLFWLLGI